MASTSSISASVLLFLGTLLNGVKPTLADNPIVQDIYTADPGPIVHDGRIYLFTGHDADGSTGYDMSDWRLFSSADMANWQHHGTVMDLTTFSWVDRQAWAGQVIARNDLFYYYVPVHNSLTGHMAIGVGVSDTIIGPYSDAIGGPLVENSEIDPTVFIDDDGQAYLYWGNPNLWYVALNEDMISYSGEITQVNLTTATFGVRPDATAERPSAFEEAPWLYKRGDIYYMLYAANCCPEDIRYSTGPSATGPWTYQGLIMASAGESGTNHPGIVEFGDQAYFFYHNSALPGGSSFTRSVAVEAFMYNEDGTIPEMNMTAEGSEQVRSLDPFVQQEAETMAWEEGIETEDCSEGSLNIWSINNGDYIKVKGVAFGAGATSFTARVASEASGGNIELRLDSEDGMLIGTCVVENTGGWQTWTSVSCPVTEAVDTHDLYFVFTGTGEEDLFNFNWWVFE